MLLKSFYNKLSDKCISIMAEAIKVLQYVSCSANAAGLFSFTVRYHLAQYISFSILQEEKCMHRLYISLAVQRGQCAGSCTLHKNKLNYP